MLYLLFFATFCGLTLVVFLRLSVRVLLSKKRYKNYKQNVSFLNRWFLWSAPQMVKDKFSKSERRVIHYTAVVKFYRFLDIFIHIAYVAVLVVLGAEWLGICPDILLNSVLFCYFVIVWMMFFALWILEFVINGKEHRSRY